MSGWRADDGRIIAVSRHDVCVVEESLTGFDVVIERRAPGAATGDRTVLWSVDSEPRARRLQERIGRDFR